MQDTSNKLISVVVVAGGKENYLQSCLDSIKNQTHSNFEIIVIDNSLKTNFAEEIIKSYPEIKLYSQPENLFYSAGLNKGIQESNADFVLCLNDDVVLDAGFIQEALSGFLVDSCVGLVSGKILRQDKVTLDSTGLFLTPWRTARERGYGRRAADRFNLPGYIFAAGGAAAFYRRSMLEEIKIDCEYFDSDFRMFYEDLDIAWRANLFGWKAYYIPGAIAYHLRGASARAKAGIGKPFARRYLNDELYLDLIKNRYLSIIKNESFCGFLFHLPLIIIYDFLSFLYVLALKPRLLRRLLSNLRYFKSAFRKRRIIRKMRK